MNKLGNILFAIVFLVVFGGITSGIYMTATASGKVDYCYVHESQMGPFPLYTLVGHRSWRQDRNIVSATSYQELIDKATIMKCPLGVSR